MNRPCKELKRIARENLSGQYRISMGAILALGIIPLAAELPFSMLQNSGQPIGQTVIFYVADFLISLITFLLSAGVIYFNLHIARRQKPTIGMVFYALEPPGSFSACGNPFDASYGSSSSSVWCGNPGLLCEGCGGMDDRMSCCVGDCQHSSDRICAASVCADGIFYAGSFRDGRDRGTSHEPQGDERQSWASVVPVFQFSGAACT